MTRPDLKQRYSRQTRLPQVGEAGQDKLINATVLIVGMGGLGSPVALYLAAAGTGHLKIADFDVVDESNLQRQIIHQHHDIGQLKTESAAASLRAINPSIHIETLDYSLGHEDFIEHCDNVDLIVDCTDNFPTRFILNDVSLATRIPLVCGAAIRWEGQVTTFDPRNEHSPCYRCLYPNTGIESATCAMEGVIAPITGVIGTMQAMEAVNVLLGQGQLHGVVWLFDAYTMEWQKMQLPKNPDCPACGRSEQPDLTG